jgi:hypothetical protein
MSKGILRTALDHKLPLELVFREAPIDWEESNLVDWERKGFTDAEAARFHHSRDQQFATGSVVCTSLPHKSVCQRPLRMQQGQTSAQ